MLRQAKELLVQEFGFVGSLVGWFDVGQRREVTGWYDFYSTKRKTENPLSSLLFQKSSLGLTFNYI